jgi:hypothetical protein
VAVLCRAAVVTAVVLCACSCAAGDRPPEAIRRVDTGRTVASSAIVEGHPLGLADADFWGDYTRSQEKTLSHLGKTGFRGLVIDVPRTVALAQHNTLPLVGWYVRTFRQDMQRDLEAQAVVAVIDLRSGELRTAPALDSGKPRPSPVPSGNVDPGEGVRSEMFETDLRRAVDLPWTPGRFAVAMILQDWISNVVTTELAGRGSGGNSGGGGPVSIWPPPARGGDLPDFRRRPDSPDLPDGPGIALAATPTVTVGRPLIIRGSFRLPMPADEPRAVGVRGPGAVLPFALVATGTQDPGPFSVVLRVPADTVEGDLAVGYFAVDLVALHGIPRASGVYFVHALGRGATAPPLRVAVVGDLMH